MKTIMLLVTIALTNLALPAWASDPAAHAQMAICLRSDQGFMQCHDALHKECQSMMGGSCPGMEMGKDKHKGMKQKK